MVFRSSIGNSCREWKYQTRSLRDIYNAMSTLASRYVCSESDAVLCKIMIRRLERYLARNYSDWHLIPNTAISHAASTYICVRFAPVIPVVVVVVRSGGGTSCRARQTGAGEHRLGATLAAGGAATAATVEGRRATSDWTGSGRRRAFSCSICTRYPTRRPSGTASLTLPSAPDNVFGAHRRPCFVEPRGSRTLFPFPRPSVILFGLYLWRSDSPRHIHARCLLPASDRTLIRLSSSSLADIREFRVIFCY